MFAKRARAAAAVLQVMQTGARLEIDTAAGSAEAMGEFRLEAVGDTHKVFVKAAQRQCCRTPHRKITPDEVIYKR